MDIENMTRPLVRLRSAPFRLTQGRLRRSRSEQVEVFQVGLAEATEERT
jgi:hypothetical protein